MLKNRDGVRNWYGLNRQFIIYFLLFAYIPLFIFSVLGYYLNKDLVREVHLNHLKDLNAITRARIHDRIRSFETDIYKRFTMANHDVNQLKQMLETSPGFRDFWITGQGDTLTNRSGAQLPASMPETFKSTWWFDKEQDAFYLVTALTNTVDVIQKLNRSFWMPLLKSDDAGLQHILYSRRQRLYITSGQDTAASSSVTGAQDQINNDAMSVGRLLPEGAHLSVERPVNAEWQLITRKSTEGIFAELKGFLFEIIIANVFIGIFMLIIAVILSRRITNPIHSLIREVKKIGRGELSQPIKIQTRNEVKTLADEFELMRQKLMDSYANLESKIEERTEALREAQFQISHQEKMASLGIMAAGVAHEIGNPLTSISSMAQLIKRKSDDDSVVEYLNTILENINRISRIVRELVDFARPSSYEANYVNVNELIENAVSIVKYDRRAKHVDIELDLSRDLPELYLVADQLLQVFINILINAVDALGGDKSKIYVRSYQKEDFIYMEFEDTGVGIPEDNISKIFEPFFTTKAVGKGTGLGLSVSYGIVKNFGGTIEVKSVIGQGSRFTIKIPENTEEAEYES